MQLIKLNVKYEANLITFIFSLGIKSLKKTANLTIIKLSHADYPSTV